MQPLDPGHLLCLLADLDAVAGEHQATVDEAQRAALHYNFSPAVYNRIQEPGLCPEMGNKRGIQLRVDPYPAHKGAGSALVHSYD